MISANGERETSEDAIGHPGGRRLPDTARAVYAAILLLLGILAAACNGEAPFELEATGPFAYLAEYPAVTNPPQERVAILVTVTNRSGDDLQVSPGDFVARDSDHHIYPANPTATPADARSVRRTLVSQGLRDLPPLPAVTLRQGDVLSGFVVFDVPVGVRPMDLVWRQSDADTVAHLSSPQHQATGPQ